MKKTLVALLSLLLSLTMVVSAAYVVFAAPEGESEEQEAVAESGESEGESAENTGESAEEAGSGEEEAGSDEQAGGFTTTGWQGDSTEFDPIEYFVIAAEGDQAELGYLESTPILEADGLKFKDMNKNGELDIYEDWRQSIPDRVEDLYAQMTDEERCMLLYHVCTCGDNAGVTYNNHTLYEQDYTWGEKYASMSSCSLLSSLHPRTVRIRNM